MPSRVGPPMPLCVCIPASFPKLHPDGIRRCVAYGGRSLHPTVWLSTSMDLSEKPLVDSQRGHSFTSFFKRGMGNGHGTWGDGMTGPPQLH